MILRKFSIVFLILTVIFGLTYCQVYYESYTKELKNAECQDVTGRNVKHSMHFVPPGTDQCQMCVCDNGSPKACRTISCTPPGDCKSFRVGASCCEFHCLDDKNSNGFFSMSSAEVIFYLIIIFALIMICLYIFCNFKKLKKDISEFVDKQRTQWNLRNKKEATRLAFTEEIQSTTRPQTDPLKISFAKDLEMSTKLQSQVLAKNEEIERLKNEIVSLKKQLEEKEHEKIYEQIGKAEKLDDDWRKTFDLPLELDDDDDDSG